MNTAFCTSPKSRHRAAFALLIVLTMLAISMVALLGALNWTATNGRQTVRNTDYSKVTAAAEAGTEKIVCRIIDDFLNVGESEVYDNLTSYRALVPTTTENAYWSQFQFFHPSGATNSTYVDRVQNQIFTNLNSQYLGLKGWVSRYRVVANASTGSGARLIRSAVGQELETAAIPIFQYAIFYGLDLELHSMTDMDVRGRVHSNKKLYTYPSATTTFYSDVTVVDDIIKTRKPGDPDFSNAAAKGSTIYKAKKDTKVSSLNLPIGTNNTPDVVRQVLNIPPSGEDIDSALGRQRYYNKAELVIVVTNTTVSAFAKAPFSDTKYTIPWTNLNSFVATNISFTDQREGKVIKATEIDVSKIAAWSVTNNSVINAIGAKAVNLVYIADNRVVTGSQLTGVRLKNGQTLPTRGLTVATPNPLYVKGHFNQPTTAHLGTTNTSNTKPASLVSDALTILSGDWNDADSASDYTSRDASDTTVNAAILTGIVETSSGIYSGGAHNLGRFLEDWSGRTLSYNGSMVVLFNSIKATAPFQQPGDYYDPPERDFAFDLNFLDGTKLPPGTPELRDIVRSQWATLAPNTTSF